LFNGILKVPMQFVILLTGVLVFVFYLFTPPPIFFDTTALARVAQTPSADALQALQARYQTAFDAQRVAAAAYVAALDDGAAAEAAARGVLRTAAQHANELRGEAKRLVAA